MIESNHRFVEIGNFVAVVDLLVTVEVYGSVVDAEFVHTEEWDRDILLVQINNFHEHISAIDLLLGVLDAVVEGRDAVYLGVV